MLLVGDRVVLRANGPPDAEYALFESDEIELRASEPGRVREHGYQTTAGRARARLAQSGVTPALARECGAVLSGALAEAYARGPGARLVAPILGALELFEAGTYDAHARVYRGAFLDLATLARDLAVEGASAAMQALHLALVLDAEPEDTTVFLSTDAWTKNRRPGERTHRRSSLAAAGELVRALEALHRAAPHPAITDHLARADVIAFLRARTDAAADEAERGVYLALERALAQRRRPERGPLAHPDAWAIEERLDTGDLAGVTDAIDAIERAEGRTPATTYLRARASLVGHLEPAKVVAERVSALALSMTSFQELSLLAAEAWLEAGDARRATPYARDLVDAPQVDEGLLLKAQRLLARAVGAAPDALTTASAAPPPRPSSAAPPPRPSSAAPPARVRARPESPQAIPAAPPPPLDLELTPPPRVATFTVDLPGPDLLSPITSPRASPSTTPPPSSRRAGRRRMTGATIEQHVRGAFDPRAEPESGRTLVAPAAAVDGPEPVDATLPDARAPAPEAAATSFVHGAEHPPLVVESPPPPLPPAALPPPDGADELLEHLWLPAGLGVEPRLRPALPRSPLEARVTFTHVARELALDYRLQRGIELSADERGIEAMQAALLESFRATGDAYELYRHGAALSEILARRIDARWADVSPPNVGDWSMIVAPDLRIWPFARVARFVERGHKERDLVSYFFELFARGCALH